jgi:uncharacterized protein (DUF58 family)
MIPQEILHQIRTIEIRSGKLVTEMFAGQYSSVFKGRGMEFAEVREYLPGDDVRTIDWNVTARYGRPFVKKFIEERELTVILLVDVSASQRFGTRDRFKAELAAELASVLAFSALRNNDRIGMVMFSDRIEKVIRPKKGRNHVLRLIRETLCAAPQGRGTDIALALRYLGEVWRRKAVVFLLSDFIGAGFEQALRVAGRRHDLIAVQLSDPREQALPPVGLVHLEDAETGAAVCVDTTDDSFVRACRDQAAARQAALRALLARAHVDHIPVTTGEPYILPLVRFFRQREKRIAR